MMVNKCATVSIFDQHDLEREDELTPVQCLACGGHWRRITERNDGSHYTEFCEWCIRGGMNEKQMIAWRSRRSKIQVTNKSKSLNAMLQDYIEKIDETVPKATNSTTGFRIKLQKK